MYETLEKEFIRHGDKEIAIAQAAYMKDHFPFYGIKAPQRRNIQKPFLQRKALPDKQSLPSIVKTLWERPQREWHYFAQELTAKYHRQYEIDDIALFEHMITQRSWWDTIDYIATNSVGPYFKKFPEERQVRIQDWLDSDNIWLQRTCLLFQLKYKEELEKELLTNIIQQLLGSNEFFINKAIGWILRSYSRVDADWVSDFVARHDDLHSLSKREALKLIDKQK